MSGRFSIVILTRDEERNIVDCLATVSWCDDVVVVDSGSRDRTVELATVSGARVVAHPFEDFASQRNWAMETVELRYDWVFHLDADERFTPELRRGCEEAVERGGFSGYFVPAKTIFMGRFLRWASLYPSFQVRLVRRGELRFVEVGHGQREAEALHGCGYVREPYLHHWMSKGVEEWVERHNRYSSAECRHELEGAAEGRSGGAEPSGPVRRRRVLKRFSRRLPLRPWLRFLYMYVLRLGFLDGRPGLVYCRLLALYEAMIELKLTEARWRRSGRPW